MGRLSFRVSFNDVKWKWMRCLRCGRKFWTHKGRRICSKHNKITRSGVIAPKVYRNIQEGKHA
jgi:hypothetical protein